VKNEELFNTLLKKLEHARVGDIQQYHTNAVSDPKKAFVGPVTKVCCVYIFSLFFNNIQKPSLIFFDRRSGLSQGSHT
jgi:hypothetical protein